MTSKLKAGDLRHRVRFDRWGYVPDSGGNVQDQESGAIRKDWVPVVTVWAKIVPLSVREFIQSNATQVEVVARITIRKRSDLTPSMRAVHVVDGVDSEFYGIGGFLADPDSGLDYVTIPATAGVNDGE